MRSREIYKFFVFDRDNTIIDKNNRLINGDDICRIIQEIDNSDNCSWAIASAGGSELQADPGFKAITSQIELNKDPAYVLYNRGKTLVRCIKSVSNESIHIEGEESKNCSPQQLAQMAFNTLLHSADFKFDHYCQIYDAPLNNRIKVSRSAQFKLKLGNYKIRVNADPFLRNINTIAGGDFKLFAVMMAMDQANLRLNVTDELAGLGIIHIAVPFEYQTICSDDVIFIDDKKRNCELLRTAGFTAIDADTACSKDHHDEQDHNKYLNELNTYIEKSKTYFINEYLSDCDSFKVALNDLFKYRELRLDQRHEVLAEVLKSNGKEILQAAYEHPFFSRHRDDAKTREGIRKGMSKLFSTKEHDVWPTKSQDKLKARINELSREEMGKGPEKRK